MVARHFMSCARVWHMQARTILQISMRMLSTSFSRRAPIWKREIATLFYLTTCVNYRNGLPSCSRLINAGARVDTRDAEGRTLFHAIARNNSAGYSVWHASVPFLARHYRCVPVPTGLVRHLGLIGVDPLQPNHEGQTPLHLFSMFQTGGFDDREDLKRQGYTGLDYLISLQRDVSHADRNGVTALHHASSFSEFNTRRLHEAGAAASLATNEGF